MYNSPIHLFTTDIAMQIAKERNEAIYKAVCSYGVNVDKDELLRALQYDRDQYEKGYADAQPKWIPVTERLPKEDEDVIAFCYYHESWQAQVCHLSSNYKGQWYTSVAGQWVHVTHWMPLPELPKEAKP